MSSPVTDLLVYTDPVVVPDDADPLNAASVTAAGVGFQALADRTNNLATRTGGDTGVPGEFAYLDAAGVALGKSRVRLVFPIDCGTHTAQIANGSNAWYAPVGRGDLSSIVNLARIRLDLNKLLPDGAIVTDVRSVIAPGAARSVKTTNPGDNGRMWCRLLRGTPDFATPAINSYGADIGAQEDAGGTAIQVLPLLGVISETIDKSASVLMWELIAGDDAGTNRDDVHAIRISYTDPGPQNF